MEKVYIETTIPSYIVARSSRDINILSHQDLSKEWWDNNRTDYKLYISQIVIDEISLGDEELAVKRNNLIKGIPVLHINSEIEALAKKYMGYFKFPEKAIRDSFHIAFAVYYKMDFLLTWNCSHLANANVRLKLVKYNNELGYNTPDICTPEELKKISDTEE